MQKHYKILFVLCAAFLLLLPVLMLVFSLLPSGNHTLPDYYSSEYLAITSADGEEYVFRPSDRLFAEARTAFLCAALLEDGGADACREGRMTVEWIKDGISDRYMLSFSEDLRAAYIADTEGHLFRLREAELFPFLQSEAGASVLIGKFPPALRLDGKTVSPSVLEWLATVADRNGEACTLTSGDRLLSPAPVRLASPQGFLLTFEKEPTAITYTVFCGEERILDGTELPSSFDLPAGEYQLVLISEWEEGNTAVRAGYSIIFSVA